MVPALLSEEARVPHKGNLCLAAEELWKPTIIYNTVTFQVPVILSKFSVLITSYILTPSWPAGYKCPTYKESFQVR